MTKMAELIVTDYGVKADAAAVQTRAFQAALDACRDLGGGTVVVPAGQFVIGSIRLYSNTRLLLKTGALIKGSTNLADYQTFGEDPSIAYLHADYYIKAWHLPPYYFHALIAAYDATDITIEAEPGAIIDGQDVFDPAGEESFRGPMGMVFARVSGLTLKGYTIQNAANWAHVIARCKDVQINSVTVLGGHDGFDLHHSQAIEIGQCVIKSGDDCLAGYDITDLTVHDTVLNTACNSLRIGGRQLKVTRCLFTGPGEYPHRSENTHDTHAMVKWYAMAADVAVESTTFEISDSVMFQARNLVTYTYGDKVIMQDGQPLRVLSLVGDVIGQLEQTSKFFGHGQPVQLKLSQCQVTPPSGQPLLQIDDAATVVLDDVTLTAPTTIRRRGQPAVALSSHIAHQVI